MPNRENDKISPLLDRFKTLESILSVNHYISDTTRRLSRILEDADSKTQLLFMGKERVGKTSVINALLGRELLPSAKNAPTEVTIFIKYGTEDRIEAVFSDGYIATFSLNKIEFLSSGKTLLGEIILEHIDYLIIYIKHDLLKQVTLIDTRAVEMVDHQKPYFSEIILNRVDEIFWIIRGNSPATENELGLLRKISLRHMKPYVIVNAIDEIGPNADKFIQEERARYGDYICDIAGVSAKQAMNARKTNNTQELIDSRYTVFSQLIQTIALNSDKKNEHIMQQLQDWLIRLRKEIETIPAREPYISAIEKVQKHIDESKLEFSRVQRDLAIIKTYESDYEQTAKIFKPVQTLYQLLKIMSQELYLRDETTESFEELASTYLQLVRNYRNIHSDYEAEFAVFAKNVKKSAAKDGHIEVTSLAKTNTLQVKDRIILLNEKQRQLGSILADIQANEKKISEQLYGIQNHLTSLAVGRLKRILAQVTELNNQRKFEYDSIVSYKQKLEEFACIIEAQQFLQDGIKPYIETEVELLSDEDRQNILTTIEMISSFKLEHIAIQHQVETDESLIEPILVDFEKKYNLHALRLTEKDVLSELPELPALIVEA